MLKILTRQTAWQFLKILNIGVLHTHQRHSEGSNKTLCAPGPRDLTETESDLPWSVWSAVACHGDRGSACHRPWRHSMWHKSSWRRSSLIPRWNPQADNPQTREQLHQRSSLTTAKVPGPTADFPTWGSGKGTENPQGI